MPRKSPLVVDRFGRGTSGPRWRYPVRDLARNRSRVNAASSSHDQWSAIAEGHVRTSTSRNSTRCMSPRHAVGTWALVSAAVSETPRTASAACRAAASRSARQRPGPRREHRPGRRRQDVPAGRRRTSSASSAGPAPCAPTPGASSGPWTAARSDAVARRGVADRRADHEARPSRWAPPRAVQPARVRPPSRRRGPRSSRHRARRRRRTRVLHLGALRVGGERSTNRPRPWPRGELDGGLQRAEPEVRRDRERVAGQRRAVRAGTRRRRRPSSSRCRRAWRRDMSVPVPRAGRPRPPPPAPRAGASRAARRTRPAA